MLLFLQLVTNTICLLSFVISPNGTISKLLDELWHGQDACAPVLEAGKMPTLTHF
ncbi:MAG TPA: hypothetical protein V6D09_17815 [Leptolyngbyaceae cyanobacterium]